MGEGIVSFDVQRKMASLTQPRALSPSAEEVLILSALRRGLTNKEIASLDNLDIETVRSRVRVIIPKLRARSRADLMRAASDMIERAALERAAPGEESAPTSPRRLAREREEIDAATTTNVRRRFWVTAGSAFVSGVLSIITSLSPDWIERVFGLQPGSGYGFVEWAIAICLVTLTASLSFVAGHEWQRISWQS